MPAPRQDQSRVSLGNGTNRNAHAQEASHYHYLKAYPAAKRESMGANQKLGVIFNQSNVRSQRLVEERHLLGCRGLKQLKPSRQRSFFYRWILQSSPFNPFKEDVRRCRKIMQLNGGAQRSGSQPQRIPLASSPGAPFDNYSKTESEQFLTELPLQPLDLTALFFIPEVQ